MNRAMLVLLSCLFLIVGASVQSEANDSDTVRLKAQKVLQALNKNDFETVSQYVHPGKGLRFSPDAHLDDNDRVVQKQNIVKIPTDSATYDWGGHDYEADSTIRLTGKQYASQYLRPTVPRAIKKTALNVRIGVSTNSSNLSDVYPGRMFVEYHTFGDNPEYDWASLRLVFLKSQGDWYLVAIVSDAYVPHPIPNGVER